jgi:hypothetical protein
MPSAVNFLEKQQKQRRCTEMAAETSGFDQLLQLPQVPARPVSAKPAHGLAGIFEAYNPKRKLRCRLATEKASCHISDNHKLQAGVPPHLPICRREGKAGVQPRRSTGT